MRRKYAASLGFFIGCALNLILLTSCAKYFYYDNNTLREKINSVELVMVNDLLPDVSVNSLGFLPAEEIDGFLRDLSLIRFTYAANDPPDLSYANEDEGIRVHYSDGSVELITCVASITYNSAGEETVFHGRSCAYSEFEALWQTRKDVWV